MVGFGNLTKRNDLPKLFCHGETYRAFCCPNFHFQPRFCLFSLFFQVKARTPLKQLMRSKARALKDQSRLIQHFSKEEFCKQPTFGPSKFYVIKLNFSLKHSLHSWNARVCSDLTEKSQFDNEFSARCAPRTISAVMRAAWAEQLALGSLEWAGRAGKDSAVPREPKISKKIVYGAFSFG